MSRTRGIRRIPQDPYHHPSWPPIRRHILKRDHHDCQIRGPGCTHVATSVDHIVSWRAGHEYWFAITNLRAACGHCNSARMQPTDRATAAPSRAW